jgi:hypothetical protein
VGHHLEDVRSDLSAIHRIDEIEAMPAPRFYSLVYRLSAYPGVIQARVRAQSARKSAQRAAMPSEMSATEWLAAKPELLKQIDWNPPRR